MNGAQVKQIASFYGLGLSTTIFLFFIMAKLIEPVDKNVNERIDHSVNYLLSRPESKTKTRERMQKVKPIEKPPVNKVEPKRVEQKQVKMDQPMSMPQMEFKGSMKWTDGILGGAQQGGPEGDSDGGGVASNDQISTPIVRIEPQYPREAALKGDEGWVIAEFDITEVGSVTNIKIIEGKPPRVFDKATRQALLKWKYRPKIENGKGVLQQGIQVKLEFKLQH